MTVYGKSGSGTVFPHQFEWYRDNNLVYYRLRHLSGAVLFCAHKQSQKADKADIMLACKNETADL